MRYFEEKELRQRADELKAILLRDLGVKLSPLQESEFERSIEFCMHNAMASVQDHYSVGAGRCTGRCSARGNALEEIATLIDRKRNDLFASKGLTQDERRFGGGLLGCLMDEVRALKATSTPPAQNIAPGRKETPENGLFAAMDGMTDRDKVRTAILDTRMLTKREAFAMAAMQGMLTADADEQHTTARIVSISVNLADALLAKLAKDGGK